MEVRRKTKMKNRSQKRKEIADLQGTGLLLKRLLHRRWKKKQEVHYPPFSFRGSVWPGEAGRGAARHGTARQGTKSLSFIKNDEGDKMEEKARGSLPHFFISRLGVARQGEAGQGKARQGKALKAYHSLRTMREIKWKKLYMYVLRGSAPS